MRFKRFTLIELLVVVAIIGVPAACWAANDASAKNYLNTVVGYAYEPFRKQAIDQDPANELYLIHTGGLVQSLFVVRPSTSWGQFWGRPMEYHHGRLYPGVELDPDNPHVMARTTGEGVWAGGIATYADLREWSNPYLLMDGHVELQDSLYHSDNEWHQMVNWYMVNVQGGGRYSVHMRTRTS